MDIVVATYEEKVLFPERVLIRTTMQRLFRFPYQSRHVELIHIGANQYTI